MMKSKIFVFFVDLKDLFIPSVEPVSDTKVSSHVSRSILSVCSKSLLEDPSFDLGTLAFAALYPAHCSLETVVD